MVDELQVLRMPISESLLDSPIRPHSVLAVHCGLLAKWLRVRVRVRVRVRARECTSAVFLFFFPLVLLVW